MMRVRRAPSAWRIASSRNARSIGQKQIGDVGARDEQNKGYDGHQDLERF